MGSGLKINYEKSNIMHLDERNMMGLFMERIIGFSAKTFLSDIWVFLSEKESSKKKTGYE